MKAYICDACGEAIHAAYELKLKYRNPAETYKKKIHLCSECFHSLHEIAAKKEPEPKKSFLDAFRDLFKPFNYDASSSYYAFESREIERIRKEGEEE